MKTQAKHKMKMWPLRERGLSLLEAALSLGVLAGIVGASVYGYNTLKYKMTGNAAINDMIMIRDSIRKLYAVKNDYSGFLPEVYRDSGASPEHLRDATSPAATGLRSAFHRNIGARSHSFGCAGCDNSFRVQYTLVPTQYCAKLIAEGTGIDELAIQTGPNLAALIEYTPPYNVPALIAACQAGGTTFVMRWIFE